MAVDPDELDEIAATVAAIYREAETALARVMARHLAGDLDDPELTAPAWAERKLAALGSLRRSAQAIAAALTVDGENAMRAAAARAFRAGWTSALADLPARWFPRSELPAEATAAVDELPGFAAVEALATAVHTDVGQRARNIVRDVLDAYRDVVTAATARIVTGVQTRRQAAQAAWQRLTDRGITGFTDRGGRRWQLSSYVEMATRTVAQRAAVQGQTDRLDAIGVRLVYVSNHGQECHLCRPYEGRVLRLDTGPTGEVQVPHQLTDEPVTVDVVATLAEAQLAGLMHPNCRHSLSAFLPGVTRLPEQPTADPDGDDARQRQRAIERKIRRHKVRQAAALDETARREAGRRVRAAQAELREHLDAHPELKRLRYREQIGAGNIPPAGRQDSAGEIGTDAQATIDGDLVRDRAARPTAEDQAPEPAAVDPDQLDLLDVEPEPEPAPAPEPAPLDVEAMTDDELAEAVGLYADDPDTLDRVLAEMDRREAAAAEPEPAPAEPPNVLAMSDDELADAVALYADDPETLDLVLAEMDQREAERQAAEAQAPPVDEDQADEYAEPDDEDPDAERWAEVDRLVDEEGWDYEEAYAEVFEKDVERMRRDEVIARLRGEGYRGRGFDELARAAYQDRLERDYFAAEAATNGFMLTAEGQRRGLDPRMLWRQNETYARRWASDELKQWWDENGRITFDQFRAELLSGGNEQRERTGAESWLQ